MVIVKVLKYEGRYKIKCGCGKTFLVNAVKWLSFPYEERSICCKNPDCENEMLLDRIPFLGNFKPPTWQLLGRKSSSTNYGIHHSITSADYRVSRSNFRSNGRYGELVYR